MITPHGEDLTIFELLDPARTASADAPLVVGVLTTSPTEVTHFEGHWWRRRPSRTTHETRYRLVLGGEVDDGLSPDVADEVGEGRFTYRGIEYPLRRLDDDAERAAYEEHFAEWP